MREDLLREGQHKLLRGQAKMNTFMDAVTELDETYKKDADILVRTLAIEEDVDQNYWNCRQNPIWDWEE
eukprot:7900581-Pyramimonas_sp.AAC.1